MKLYLKKIIIVELIQQVDILFMTQSIAIIGGGPAGLMAAEIMSQHDVKIDVYEAMPSLARKFLMAGKSGLNLTHAEDYAIFITRYGNQQHEIVKHLANFTPTDLLAFTNELNIKTFIGSSGRVFPVEMKASPFLRAWIQRLQARNVTFHLRHRWSGWEDQQWVFETPAGIMKIKSDATILALGGASWPKLGSKGDWVPWLKQAGIKVAPFSPANCGFYVNWSPHFSEKFHGQPIKSVTLTFKDFKQQGEFVITQKGVEGSLIYSASAKLRDELTSTGQALLTLDLAPDASIEKLTQALLRPRGSTSLSNHIRKTTGIQNAKLGLLYEFFTKDTFDDPNKLAKAIKTVPISLVSPAPLATAISCAGGISFEELDDHLMLRKMPGVFCAGEMLDWEAPTGGYLLSACFALGKAAGNGALDWLSELRKSRNI
jgi:uncharacterized flavoprotein (TIGR03862 family)